MNLPCSECSGRQFHPLKLEFPKVRLKSPNREGVDAVRHDVEDEIRTSGVTQNGTASGILVASI
jgi:hypothetical protein